MSSLLHRALYAAHTYPALSPHLYPLIHKHAGPKVALAKDTEDFIEWVLATQEKMNPNAVQRFLEQKLGREPVEPIPGKKRNTGPLQKGETVLVNARNNTNPLNVDACEAYHNRVGMVEDVGDGGLTIAFYTGNAETPSTTLSGDKHFFDGVQSGKKSGLYRWTPKTTYQEHAVGKKVLLEVVYLRAGQRVDQRSIEQIERYVDLGEQKGENRSRVYYTGLVGKFAYGKDGDMYFALSSQQRDRPTFISPAKGKVLYIGVAGRRPAGWKQEAVEMGLMLDSRAASTSR